MKRKFRYEFETENDDFYKGRCCECPLGYEVEGEDRNITLCSITCCNYMPCPLEEVENE